MSVVLTVRIIAHKLSFRDDIPTSMLVPSHRFIFLCLNRINRRGGVYRTDFLTFIHG